MKETGLMFKAPLVRAILSGQKTQTRRLLKQAVGPSLSVGMVGDAPGVAELSWLWGDGPGYDVHETVKRFPCPVGQPGDRIYVRETFGYGGDAYTPDIYYRASQLDAPIQGCWHPAIHMRKADARIWLEVTAVRVERLHDITEADARAEGITDGGCCNCGNPEPCGCQDPSPSARDSFASLWQTTGGDWAANPWVWVIDFKTISTTGRPA